MRRGMLFGLAACGRLGFEERPVVVDVDAPPPPPTVARDLPCRTPVLLDMGGHNSHDIIRWVFDGEADWIVGADHYQQEDHKIEAHQVTSTNTVVSAGAAVQVAQANHVDVISFAATPSGFVLGYWDFTLGTAHVVALGANMTATAPTTIGALYGGNPPLARIGGGKIAFAGQRDGLRVVEVNDDATPSGRELQLVNPADGAGPPSLTTVDDGVIVIWASGASGGCKLAKLAPDFTIGVAPVAFAAQACKDPHVAWLETERRLIAVAESGTNIVAQTFDANLAPLDAPHVVVMNASWPRIAGDGDAAWLTWVEPPKTNFAMLDRDALVTSMGTASGALDQTLGHYHQIDRVANETVITWTDSAQNRTFVAQRMCR